MLHLSGCNIRASRRWQSVYRVPGTALRLSECKTKSCDAKISRHAEKFQACVVFLSQSLQSNAKSLSLEVTRS